MKILVVDDDLASLRLLRKLLETDGHEVVTAVNGQEGVDRFVAEKPVLVLLDALMPVMDGFTAARLIKEQCRDRFVPVLFLTALSEEAELARCLECGGDDFVVKPYRKSMLRAKIHAFQRIQRLTAEINRQREELAQQQAILAKELAIADSVMKRIVNGGAIRVPALRTRVLGKNDFCGDLIIASRTPSGGFMVFLGDVTGHGLPAAVCAVPVAQTFHSMARKGFSAGEIATEINNKLSSMLGAGLFCAAVLIDANPARQTITIWNGGLPEVLLVDHAGHVVRRIASTHLALGVLAADSAYAAAELLEPVAGQRILAYSDGVVEARALGGAMFGQENLERALSTARGDLLAATFDSLQAYCAGADPDDDLSALQIDCGASLRPEASEDTADSPDESYPPENWHVTWRLDARALRFFEPLPKVIKLLREMGVPSSCREAVCTIIAELYANALDHGVLSLDSALKSTPEGFGEYYRRRGATLAALQNGALEIDISCETTTEGGELRMRLTDSGAGFCRLSAGSTTSQSDAYSGRGMRLVQGLCKRVSHNATGNEVTAVYEWQSLMLARNTD